MMVTINLRTKPAKLAVSLAMLLFVVLSFGGITDKVGQEYTETSFNRALVTFASARALNGLISVFQGTEVAIQPGGLGTVLTPGQILDPINDLVEQFSQVMLFSTAVLGTQKVLIEISGWFWFSALLASVIFFWLAALWLPHLFAPRTQRITLGLAGILLLFRFLVPAAAITNEAVFDLFLSTGYNKVSQQIEDASKDLESEEPTGEESRSIVRSLKNFFKSAKAKIDVRSEFEELKKSLNETVEDIIELIVIFMVQTLLLPILFAWLGYSAAKGFTRYALLKSE